MPVEQEFHSLILTLFQVVQPSLDLVSCLLVEVTTELQVLVLPQHFAHFELAAVAIQAQLAIQFSQGSN